MSFQELLIEQLNLLASWNERNIDAHPERVTNNIALFLTAYSCGVFSSDTDL